MIANTTDSVHRLPLRIEAAPAFGGGTMSVEEERTFVLLAHLFPIVVWLWKRKESPAVDAHGKEALNMALTLLLAFIPLGIVSALIGSVVVAGILSILTSLLSVALLLLVVVGALKARQGWIVRYPGNLRLIK